MLYHADVCLSLAQLHSFHIWTLLVTRSFVQYMLLCRQRHVLTVSLVYHLWGSIDSMTIISHTTVYCMLNQNDYSTSFSCFWTFHIKVIHHYYVFRLELLSIWEAKVMTMGWDGNVWQTEKRFPLRGEGWHNWTEHTVSLKMDTHTLHIHHLSPSQFPKAEGCNSLVSSFFQPQFFSLSLCPSRPFHSLSSLVRWGLSLACVA